MKLSTRTRYGTRALLELALRNEDTPVFLKDIAREQGISLAYLEQLMAPLIGGGIIRSTKGPKGGISLARRPEDINMAEITLLLEGTLGPVECVANPESCDRVDTCVTHDIWNRLGDVMHEYLQSITLKDLAERQESLDKAHKDMYYI